MPSYFSGFLIDIDGVLVSEQQRIDGALETLEFLKRNQIPFLLITNTTRKSRITIWHHLKRQGFEISEDQIFTAVHAAVGWLKSRRVERIHLLLSGSAVKDFRDFRITNSNPEYVIIGDLGRDLTFDRLNTAFRLILKGARILALQKNRFWKTAEGPTLDAGPIVAALEYATQKRAVIIGKPQKNFFEQAVKKLGLPSWRIGVIGDDLESDIKGAQKAGLKGIAVKTGKFSVYDREKIKVKPDFILESIADLPDLILKVTGENDDHYHHTQY